MSTDAARPEPIVDYFAWLHQLVPAVAADLRPPATEADIASVEARAGFTLPAAVSAMYLLHDGQHGIGESVTIGAIYGMEFLPLAEVAREWEAQAAAHAGYASWYRQQHGLADTAPVPQTTRELVVAPDEVAGSLWQPGWIPLFRQPLRRDYLAVDLQPERLGVAGQIINFGRNEHVGYVAAAGLADFFEVLLEWAAVEGTGQNVEAVREHLTGLFLDDGRVLHRMADRAMGAPEPKAAVTPLVPVRPAQPAHDEPREPAGPPPPSLADPVAALMAVCDRVLDWFSGFCRSARLRVELTDAGADFELDRLRIGAWEGFDLYWQHDNPRAAVLYQELADAVDNLWEQASQLRLTPLTFKWRLERTGATWQRLAVHPDS